jgi:hypothetical protein
MTVPPLLYGEPGEQALGVSLEGGRASRTAAEVDDGSLVFAAP